MATPSCSFGPQVYKETSVEPVFFVLKKGKLIRIHSTTKIKVQQIYFFKFDPHLKSPGEFILHKFGLLPKNSD